MVRHADPQIAEQTAFRVGAVLFESTRILFRHLVYFGVMTGAFGALHKAVVAVSGLLLPYSQVVGIDWLFIPLPDSLAVTLSPPIGLALTYRAIVFGLVPVFAMTVFIVASTHVMQEHGLQPVASVRAALRRLPSLMAIWLVLLIVLVLVWVPPEVAMAMRAPRTLFWIVPLCLIATFAIGAYGGPVVGAIAVEGLGPLRGLKRGFHIGRGARWRTVGILVVFCLVVLGGMFVFGALMPVVTRRISVELNRELWFAINLAFLGTAFCWISIVMAVGYLRLRQDKEGIPLPKLAAVFD